MPEMLGKKTHHVIYKSESHKLHEGFSIADDAAADVNVGTPVKLVGDFLVQPLAVGDNANLSIGYSILDTDKAAFAAGSTPRNSMKSTYGGLEVTVAMKAQAIIVGGAITQKNIGTVEDPINVGGAITVGPVKFVEYDKTVFSNFPQKGMNIFMSCLPTDVAMVGWALEAADPGETCKVALI